MATLRLARETDAAGMLAIYAPFVAHTTITFEIETPTEQDFRLRIRQTLHTCPWLVAEEDGRLLGYAYAHAFGERAAYAWAAEPSVYLAPEAAGKGFGSKLYLALEALLNLQGYRNMYARVTHPNPGSEAFHERLGYAMAGELPAAGYKFGCPVGIRYYYKPLPAAAGEVPFPNTPPTPFSALDSALVAKALNGF